MEQTKSMQYLKILKQIAYNTVTACGLIINASTGTHLAEEILKLLKRIMSFGANRQGTACLIAEHASKTALATIILQSAGIGGGCRR